MVLAHELTSCTFLFQERNKKQTNKKNKKQSKQNKKHRKEEEEKKPFTFEKVQKSNSESSRGGRMTTPIVLPCLKERNELQLCNIALYCINSSNPLALPHYLLTEFAIPH